eukprot:TRINITY_DN26605_c0_g1_i2.p1 TRINITY_DN26605_c0_g1~~TRINITY_DN26605_c0_g1_i2.p1  ORF type:complete len:309 (-),score=36.87 TRINITY_DN26605_c0_g1_i2:267-1193(-)
MARIGGFDLVKGVDTSVSLVATQKRRRRIQRRLNRFSYYALERLQWSGFGDLINEFREKELDLPPLTATEGPRLLEDSNTPWTYCWSPALVAKPNDWPENIDVVGFFFLNQASLMQYQPPDELMTFLQSGEPPVYIGFGSMPVMNPVKLTEDIYKAVRLTGSRVILSKGAKVKGQQYFLGEGVDNKPDNVLVIGPCPHDWLFEYCSGVIHHGGAGTTAAGLVTGCPTLVVPFFGDQPFWGQRIQKAGVGPPPCPISRLNTDVLVQAFEMFADSKVKMSAQTIAESIRREDGVSGAVWSFHRNLPEYLV